MKSSIYKKGFTLVEVMIALAIFATFATIFVAGQGYNIKDSFMIKEEVRLKELCEEKINELIINPPEFKESLTLSPETKSFENITDIEADYDRSQYEYKLNFKKMKMPDLSLIMGNQEKADNDEPGIQENLLKKIKDNMEEMIWQVEVTVTNKTTKYSLSMSTWLFNDKAEVSLY